MTKLIIDSPRVIILGVALITIFFAIGLRRGLILDVSPLGFVEHGNQARADYVEARKNFGPDDYLVIAVVSDDIFSAVEIDKLRRLHEKVASLEGVEEIVSLVNIPYARSIEGGVSLEKLLPESLEDVARLKEARSAATGDRLYAGQIVSADGKTAALNVLLKPELMTEVRHDYTRKIYEIARDAGFKEAFIAGDPVSQWRGTEAIKSDLRLFLPLTIILITFLLWLCFRSVVAVLLPLVTIALGLIWILGLMAYFQVHFTILALMLPTLMLAIGCSYMIHVVNQVGIVTEKRGQAAGRTEILKEAIEFIGLPVIVSALTIIAGFLSLAFTSIPAIRTTAVYAAIGAAFTMILSLTLVPAVLRLLPARAWSFRVGLGGTMVKFLEDTGRWATSRQKLLYLLTALIIIISLIGMRNIRIDIDYFRFFKPNAETSIWLDEINRRLSGVVIFEIIIEGDKPGAIEDAEVLRRMVELQTFAEAQRYSQDLGIDQTVSVADFVKALNRAFHDNDPKFQTIPDEKAVIQDLFSDRDQLRRFITPDGKIARVMVRSTLSSSQSMAGAIRAIEKRGRELMPDFKVVVTGTLVLLNRTSDRIAREQIQSVTIALVTIFFMLSILFRSLRVGLTALVPNLIPVLFFFGFMGWRGIPLNLTTSLVASVVLGLAVDNAVQFIVRFRRVQLEKENLREAIIESMRLSGRPIIYANIALSAAFAIFALSIFEPVGAFGLLSAVTILGCLVEDLVLLPARLTSPVFKAK